MEKDYYCSQKFDTLDIRLSDGWVLSCCKAEGDRLTTKLLDSDPQGFFNWPKLVEERQMMLDNKRVPGCEKACWVPEDNGLISRRIEERNLISGDDTEHNIMEIRSPETQVPKYEGVRHLPKVINLMTSTTCNLTCSYCFKGLSSTWLRDVAEHGDYNIPGYSDRYNLSNFDRVIQHSSQRLQGQTAIGAKIMQQLEQNIDAIETLVLTGGEPLLFSGLEQLINMFAGKQIVVYTGLGVPENTLRKMLPLLEKTTEIFVSAENTGKFHEFNRYGNSYSNFTKNFELLKQHCKRVTFTATISNLTLFDFPNFAKKHHDVAQKINLCYDPVFFNPSLMDNASKDVICQQLEEVSPKFARSLVPVIQAQEVPGDREKLATFIKRFAASRNLDLNIFPKSFLSWIDSPSPKFFPIREDK